MAVLPATTELSMLIVMSCSRGNSPLYSARAGAQIQSSAVRAQEYVAIRLFIVFSPVSRLHLLAVESAAIHAGPRAQAARLGSVSYTHLTLPTSDLV